MSFPTRRGRPTMSDQTNPETICISLFDVTVFVNEDGERRLHLSRSGPDYIKKQIFELDEATLLSLLATLRGDEN